MDKSEAKDIIENELNRYSEKRYRDLIKMIDSQPITGVVYGSTGTKYQIEVSAVWDGLPQGDVRVLGSIDDGKLRAFFPLSSAFIKSPANQFVGE